MKRKGGFFRFLLLVIDIALAVWIYNSYKKEEAAAYTPPAETRTAIESTVPAQTTDADTLPVPDTAETLPVVTEADSVFPDAEVLDTETETVPVYSETEVMPVIPDNEPEPDMPSGAVIEFPPEMDAFDWYLDNVFYNGIPDGAAAVTELPALFGQWKFMFYRDPEGTAHKEKLFFYDGMIDAGQNGMVVILEETRDLDLWTGESEIYQTLDSDVFTVSMEDGALRIDLNENTRIYMHMYEYAGKQYGITGIFMSLDGQMYMAAAVRQ